MRNAFVSTGLLALVSAAAFAVDPLPKPGPTADQPMDRTHLALPISGSSKEIQAYLTKFTNETFKSTDPMARTTDMLAKADRERIHKDLQKTYPDLEKSIASFNDAWKAKYGSGFDMGAADSEVAFAGSRVLEGDVSDQAILASQQLGPDNQPKRDTLERQVDKLEHQADKVGEKVTGEKKLATVVLPASKEQSLDPVTLRVIDEGTLLTDWRVNCPDTLTAQKLHDNLKSRIDSLVSSKDQWPAHPRDAYTIVSHQILASLSDSPLPSGKPAMDNRQTGLDVED